MDLLGVVIAGCAPGEPDCAVGTVPPGMDTWFIVLVLLVAVLLLLAVVAGAALLVRRGLSRRTEVSSANDETAAHA